MNAKLRRVLGLGSTVVLAGCTASASFMTVGAGEPVEVVSRWPSSTEPNFGTTPIRADIADEPVHSRRSDRASTLVSLYGELESTYKPYGSSAFDGSSNVAQVTFATEGAP